MGRGQTARLREFFVDFRPMLLAQARHPFIRRASPRRSVFFRPRSADPTSRYRRSKLARSRLLARTVPRIASPRARLENYGKICFITRVRNVYGWMLDVPLSPPSFRSSLVLLLLSPRVLPSALRIFSGKRPETDAFVELVKKTEFIVPRRASGKRHLMSLLLSLLSTIIFYPDDVGKKIHFRTVAREWTESYDRQIVNFIISLYFFSSLFWDYYLRPSAVKWRFPCLRNSGPSIRASNCLVSSFLLRRGQLGEVVDRNLSKYCQCPVHCRPIFRGFRGDQGGPWTGSVFPGLSQDRRVEGEGQVLTAQFHRRTLTKFPWRIFSFYESGATLPAFFLEPIARTFCLKSWKLAGKINSPFFGGWILFSKSLEIKIDIRILFLNVYDFRT